MAICSHEAGNIAQGQQLVYRIPVLTNFGEKFNSLLFSNTFAHAVVRQVKYKK